MAQPTYDRAFDPDLIVERSDEELDKLFRESGTLEIECFMNSGEHRVDPARHEIFNDVKWKGYLPKGLPLGEFTARLSTGYAKRFWKKAGRYLGETQYFDGRFALKHSLEEVTIERRVNDVDPGRYILLRYTDALFEGVFYDLMKAVTEDLILYRGYTGRFPDGRRGWTGQLLRRYRFGQMGAEDHRVLFQNGAVPRKEELTGRWRLDVIANSNHTRGAGHVQFALKSNGRVESRFEAGPAEGIALPGFITGHFHLDDFGRHRNEIRRIDDQYLVGRWVTEIRGNSAKLFRGGSLGVLHAEKDDRRSGRFGLYYLLTREES